MPNAILRAAAFPCAIFLAGASLTISTFFWIEHAEERTQQATFERMADRAISDAVTRLTQPLYGLGGMRGAAAVEGGIPTSADIARYVQARDLAGEFPGVSGLGLIEPVRREALGSFERRVRSEGQPSFTVRTSGTEPDLFVIKTIEPRAANANAIGYDIGSETNRRLAAERVFRDGLATVTAPIKLLQDTRQRPGALMLAPIFQSGRPARSGPGDPVIAIVYAAVAYEDLLAGVNRERASWLRMIITDHSAQTPTQLFDSSGQDAGSAQAVQVRRTVAYFGRELEFVVEATPEFLQANPVDDADLLLLLGFLVSALAAVAAFQQVRTVQLAQSIAASMTVDLNRLAMVARLTNSAVVITDAEGKTRWVNRAFRDLTGFSDQELIGKAPGEMLQTKDTNPIEVARLSAALKAREPFSGVLLNRSKSGRDYWVQMEIQPFAGSKEHDEGFIAVEADITERLERDKAIHASRALLDETGQVAGVGGWRLDLETQALEWTEQTRRIHETPADHRPDVDNGIQFYAPEARPIIAEAIAKALASGEGWDLELPFITYTGRSIWVRAVGEVETHEGKPVALIGAFADISAVVAERQRLELERKRLAMIIEGTGAGTWEWNIQTGETRFNERWAQIVGLNLAELGDTTIQTWVQLTHPDDLCESQSRLEQHFRGDCVGYECEARMRHRDGSWIWVLDRGRVMTWSSDGQPEWMFGTHLDITERKAIELRLEESQAMLSTTLRSIGDAVLTTDADGVVTWLNPVAEALTGWVVDEAIGRPASEILNLEIEGREGAAPNPIQACLAEGRKVGLAGNTVLTSRNGDRYVIEDSAAPLREGDGPIRGVVMVFHDVTEKAHLAKEMSFRASHDSLTGLINRAEFELELSRALEQARTTESSGALLFIDLDHFKVVNDACGHAAGDQLLQQVSDMLRAAVRTRDFVGRFGGDEFAILLESCPMERARQIAERIVESVDAYRFVGEDGRRYRVGLSVGLAPLDGRWATISQLLQGADSACYAAKKQGRGRVVVEDTLLSTSADAHGGATWGPRIEQAMDEDLFELFAQRVVPLQKQLPERLSCEVLLRLKDGSGGYHSPGEFMPAAERYQLASRIDRWVLRRVLAVLKAERQAGIARVAVNFSGQSVNDRTFHQFALQAIEASGLPPSMLCVEITETALVTNFADAAAFIERLHGLGAQVALDDFGAGSSSFGYLNSLKVDLLKIDGQFVRGLLEGDLESAAVRSFVEVAKVLGLKTVAEQIENERVSVRLAELGVDFGQGYHFHRPEPLSTLLSHWGDISRGSNVIAADFSKNVKSYRAS